MIWEMGAMGECEGVRKTFGAGVGWAGLRRRRVSDLPPISEEDEEEEEEEEEKEEEGETNGGSRDFEVDSTGSSVHEERAMELLLTEEKECLKFRHRTNKGDLTHTHTHTHTH